MSGSLQLFGNESYIYLWRLSRESSTEICIGCTPVCVLLGILMQSFRPILVQQFIDVSILRPDIQAEIPKSQDQITRQDALVHRVIKNVASPPNTTWWIQVQEPKWYHSRRSPYELLTFVLGILQLYQWACRSHWIGPLRNRLQWALTNLRALVHSQGGRRSKWKFLQRFAIASLWKTLAFRFHKSIELCEDQWCWRRVYTKHTAVGMSRWFHLEHSLLATCASRVSCLLWDHP